MRQVWEFARAIGRDWIALFSGVIGIFATAFGLWGPASMSPRWVFVAFGFAGILLAAFNVWREERRRGAREIKHCRTAFMTANRRLQAIDERLTDIERQLAPLPESQRVAFAKLGRLGEIGGGSHDGWEIGAAANQVDFVVREHNHFRPTEAYRLPLSAWAKAYKPPMVQLSPKHDA